MLKYRITKNKNYIYFDSIKSIKKINDLISILNKITKINKKEIVLDFRKMEESSYSPVHVSIAGITNFYQEHKGIKIKFKMNKQDYILHTKTQKPFSAVEDYDILKSNIFDRVITFSTSEDVNFISSEIINKLKYSIDCETGVLVSLSWCMNEIMDNVFNHSKASKGFIMAQLHKRQKKVSISIYDSGQGLLNSLRQSGEFSPQNETEAIELAITRGVSGNREIGQGTGLWGLKEILQENKGYLSIQTGHVNITYNFKDDTKKISSNLPILDKENLCTRIDFSINFDNFINLNKALDNYEPMEQINCEVQNLIDYNGWIHFNLVEQATGGIGTRDSGKKLRLYLLNLMKIEVNPIIINFENIDVISSSFADEFIGKTVKEIGFVQFNSRCKLIHTNQYVSAAINKAIKLRFN